MIKVGPTVCQQFYNFLSRLRELSHESSWTSCLKEILLRVLCVFLSGPFLNADFPLDAFNKFLDRVTCPDLSYENPSTIVKIVEQCGKFSIRSCEFENEIIFVGVSFPAHALHLFVFFPNKITIRSNCELKSSTVPNVAGAAAASTGTAQSTEKPSKSQNFEQVMFRLVSFMASCVTLPYKSAAVSLITLSLQQAY